MTIVDAKMNKDTNINIGERYLYIINNFKKNNNEIPSQIAIF